jgi:hypothetical protein
MVEIKEFFLEHDGNVGRTADAFDAFWRKYSGERAEGYHEYGVSAERICKKEYLIEYTVYCYWTNEFREIEEKRVRANIRFQSLSEDKQKLVLSILRPSSEQYQDDYERFGYGLEPMLSERNVINIFDAFKDHWDNLTAQARGNVDELTDPTHTTHIDNVTGPVHTGSGDILITGKAEDLRAKELAYLDTLLARYEYWRDHYTPLAGIAEVRAAVEDGPRLDLPMPFIPPGFEKLVEHGFGGRVETRREPVDDLQIAVNEQRRILLLGDPGSGKTTTLWRLVYEYARAAKTDTQAPLPLFVPLGGYTDDGPFDAYLARCLGPLAPRLETYHASGRLILLGGGPCNETSAVEQSLPQAAPGDGGYELERFSVQNAHSHRLGGGLCNETSAVEQYGVMKAIGKMQAGFRACPSPIQRLSEIRLVSMRRWPLLLHHR